MAKPHAAKPMRGKLIVFEGSDGTGKTTHAKLLVSHLDKNKKNSAVLISFPRYEKEWGKLVRSYLNGEFGKLDEVDPRLASVLYAGDRLAVKDEIQKLLMQGKIVVCDRYAASNIAHQAAKFKLNQRKKFIKWLSDLEFMENKIPKEDLVILLTAPYSVSQKLMGNRKKDIHESNEKYLKEVINIFETLSKKKNWVKVESVEGGRLLTVKQVHEKVIAVLKKRGLLK